MMPRDFHKQSFLWSYDFHEFTELSIKIEDLLELKLEFTV